MTQLAFAMMALAILMLPTSNGTAAGSASAVIAILAIWALQTVPSTVVDVAFPVVMDGATGSSRRLDLVGRRWSIIGITTAATVVLAGQVLGFLPFPDNYALVFGAFAFPALVSWWYSHRIRLLDQAPIPAWPAGARLHLAEFAAMVAAEPRFLTFELCSFLLAGCVRMAAPLLPLYYVREGPRVRRLDWIDRGGHGRHPTPRILGLAAPFHVAWHAAGAPADDPRTALAPAVLTLIDALPLVVVLAAVASVFAAGNRLLLFEELMQRVPPRYAVTFTAVDQSTQNLAASIAPLAGGQAATVLGIRPALVVATSVGVVALVLFSLEGRGAVRSRPLH